MNSLFESENISIEPAIELGSNDLLIDLARIGLGISLVPDFVLKKDDTLFKIDIKQPLKQRSLGVVTDKTRPLSLAARKFINLLTDVQD